ncbi:hypothetical protein OPKNFCMD_0939 [Methylobacterium crusticola]|uniref:Dienelactone hydrolase domain-containing protein n=1 Tax=Methylobacterium crusticola TaxID=1697972 RepID=A0ABQ4QSE6_9HYPH|nr:dienelactone hydrolase family protein [Methylobacterium crusticola]GJD48223.1 hypothetical protein OPKNFCMD_0939 [Methylobacterium crusticola]
MIRFARRQCLLAGVCTALAWACAALASAGGARADPEVPVRIEVRPFRSRTPSGPEFLTGAQGGREVDLAAELRLPQGAGARVPAVILVHGSGGINAAADVWARALNGIGVAALILDSFSGRGIVSTVADQNQLHSLAMMVDAYRALDLLAQHPRIRADRIGIIGFSKGAVASVYSAMDRFSRTHGPAGVRFAAHVGLYTPCNIRFSDDTKVGPAPIRMFHGVADDYVAIAPCRDYAARLREAGADVALTEYPNAPHGYDNPLSPRSLAVPAAQSTRNCRLVEGLRGAIEVAGTQAAYTMADPCVATGAHVGHDPEATAATRDAVLAFFRETLLR